MSNRTRPTQIMDIAECLVRLGGYSGFSFRDLAREANIKSASIHYHFPTKEDLVLAIARRYASRMYARLGDAEDATKSPEEQIQTFLNLHRELAHSAERTCLFLMFGAEMALLPPTVRISVREYFDQSTAWLARVLARHNKTKPGAQLQRARTIISLIDGALIRVRVHDAPELFNDVIKELEHLQLFIQGNPKRSPPKQPRKVAAVSKSKKAKEKP